MLCAAPRIGESRLGGREQTRTKPAYVQSWSTGLHGHVTQFLHMQALFFNHLYDPISLVRDNEVKAAMCSLGVHCQSFNGDVLYEPWEVLAEGARPFTTFATFWNR